MGDGDGAVVDSNFKVHDTEGLRVVDASVIPQILSGNLNAPVQMLAARAVDFMVTPDEVGDYTKLPIQTRLNGEIMQDAKLSDLIFPVPRLIHRLVG